MKLVFITKTRKKIAHKFLWIKKIILPILGILISLSLALGLAREFFKTAPVLPSWNKSGDFLVVTKAENEPAKLSNYANITLPDPQNVKITKTLPVLMYHYVEPQPLIATKTRRGLTVTPEEFVDQMAWLKDNGYETITLSELYKSFFEELSLPKKPVILTFDDGYNDFFTYAAPVLANLGMTADVFIITGSVGGFGYMDWEEIKKLSELGFEIESHTVTHGDLAHMFGNKLEADLVISKTAIEKNIDKPVNFLCYPSGSYNLNVSLGAQAVSYRGAVTTKPGDVISSDMLFEMPRVRIPGGMKINDFIFEVEKSLR